MSSFLNALMPFKQIETRSEINTFNHHLAQSLTFYSICTCSFLISGGGAKGQSPKKHKASVVRMQRWKWSGPPKAYLPLTHASMRSIASCFALCHLAPLWHSQSPQGDTTGRKCKLLSIADQMLPYSGRKQRLSRQCGSDAEVWEIRRPLSGEGMV